jgi:hypothetical protein
VQPKSLKENMSQFFITWKLNSSIQPPQDPMQQVQQTEGFLALMRHQLADGSLKEVHAFLRGDAGYAITKETATEDQVYSDLQAWQPWVLFEVERTVPFPKGIELTLEVHKARARMMMAAPQ